MNLHKVVSSGSSSQLSHRLDERRALNVTHGPTELDNAHVRRFLGVVDRNLSNALYPILNRVREVRHNLNCLSQIVAFAFPLNHMLEDLARGYVIFSRQGDVKIALVVSEVKIDFAAIIESEALSVPSYKKSDG